MERLQENFIIDQLNTHTSCKIVDKYTDRIQEISTPAVRNILKEDAASGPDMQAILCMFDTIFLSTSSEKTDGLPKLSKDINRWITSMQKLNVNSVEGDVYFTDFLSDDIDVVIKVPKSQKAYTGIIREYFLGIRAINRLRYYVPNFTYTLGAFICNLPKNGKICQGKTNQSAYVLYEKVNGSSLAKIISEITFEQWLVIFVQVLLALEIGQREIRFTHFDLHGQNVMVKRSKKYQYMVPMENETYYLSNIDFMPIIIDFGMTSAYVRPFSIGKHNMSQFGIYTFMVPGMDMYKFMLYSMAEARNINKNFANQINELFHFYGKQDPYKVVTNPTGCDARREYCAKVSTSPIANYTPLMLLKWIWNKHNDILQKYMQIGPRHQYLSIKYSNTLKEYDYIFNNTAQGREKAIQLADQCVTVKPSYVISLYNLKILEEYNKSLGSNDINSRIKQIKMVLEHNYYSLIKLDMARLEKIFDIKIPSQKNFDNGADNLLSIPIKWKNAKDKLSAVTYFNSQGQWYEKLEPFMQFYYTICETNTLSSFSDWVDRLMVSDVYKFYLVNCTKYVRAQRWAQTLLVSMNM